MKNITRRIVATLIATVGVLSVTTSVATAAKPEHKVWVCKYVGKPGVDETLKGGKNPIEVDWHSIPGAESYDGVQVGDKFADAQDHSIVVQKGGENPGVEACPVPETPPTTPSTVTESTVTETTTTATTAPPETTQPPVTTEAPTTTTEAATTTTEAPQVAVDYPPTEPTVPATTVAPLTVPVVTTALPNTGSNTAGLTFLAAGLVLGGGVVVSAARRKKINN